MTKGREVARAIDALRRGWPVAIDDVQFLAIESASEAGLAEFDTPQPADLVSPNPFPFDQISCWIIAEVAEKLSSRYWDANITLRSS